MISNAAFTSSPEHLLDLRYFTPDKFFNKKIIFLLLLAFLSGSLHAQSCSDNTLYVTPGGTGIGSKQSPANLLTALAICKKDTSKHLIKLSTGTYTIMETLFIPSNVTIDGNFDATNGIWKKNEVPNCILSINPAGEEIKILDSYNQPVIVGHYIGMRLDSVQNITLKDFTLEVHKKNNYQLDMTYDGDGKSVYGIFGSKCRDIYLINLHIVTESGGNGLYGNKGLDGADAYYNVPGKTIFDQYIHTSYRPKPGPELTLSNEFRAGGAGGTGGRLQRYYRCLDCPSSVLSQTTYCALEDPLPTGGRGGKNGGAGGTAGEGCEMDCYYQYYKSKTFIKDDLKSLLELPSNNPKDPNPTAGEDGTDGTGNYNGSDYADQTILPYDDINYYYIPGKGEKGGDGSGGSGGGGGGAGGIRTLGMVPSIPGMGDYNLPVKALGLFNKLITLTGGDDVCNAEIVNGSTEGGPGGAGGEGGEGGGGGRGGGASIGVFTLLCPNVVDNNCTYTIGEGGQGGYGGYGGTGGEGGLGLPGRGVSDGSWSFQGATGGKGGDGGDGSRGQRGSKGRSIAKVGVSTKLSPFMMIDASNPCTNSVIAINNSGGGSLFNTATGSSSDVPLIKDTPSGSSYTAFMSYVLVATADTGTLKIGFSHPQLYNLIKPVIQIKTLRPLPPLNVPSVLCLGDTLRLTADSAHSYVWKIYNANEEVILSSAKRSITYIPAATGWYTVAYQAFDICCGLSSPQYRNFKVSKADKPTIVKLNNDVPYCFGSDSTKLEVTSAVQFSDRLSWTGGGTAKTVYIKNPGWHSLTLTNQDGCMAKSDSVENYVFPLPTGKPGFDDVYDACHNKEITLYPADNNPEFLYNFYYQGNSKTIGFLPDGMNKFYFNVTPSLIGKDKEYASYYVRKVNTHYRGRNNVQIRCIADEVKEIRVYKEKYPPVVIGDEPRVLLSNNISCGASYTYTHPKAEDNCHPYITSTFTYKAPLNYYSLGVNTDTISYRDISGNVLNYPVTITVVDATPPVFTSRPATNYKEISNEPGKCTAYYPFTLAQVKDNCTAMPELTGVLPQYIQATGRGYSSVYLISGSQEDSIFNVGMNTLSQSWSDANGNTTSYEQTIHVKDTEAPVLSCQDVTFYARPEKNSIFTGYNAPLVTDNCTMFLSSSFVSGFGQSGEHAIGTTEERWKATDASGNIGQCIFNLTVLDTILPSIDCNVMASASTIPGTDSALVTFSMPSALDNSGTVTVAANGKGSGSYYKLGVHKALYTATDPSGNIASCYVDVKVFDQEGPNVTCPGNIEVANDQGVCGAVVNFMIADAPDNDGTNYTPFNVMGLPSGSVFPIGITTQAYRANDANGNSGFCTFTVTVKDTEAPVITGCPGNITANVEPLVCGKSVTLPTLTVTENSCIPPSTGYTSGGANRFLPVGTTHIIYLARDNYGNTSTCEYDYTVVDNTTLSITCPPNAEVNTAPGYCEASSEAQWPRANINYGCLEWKQLSSKGIGDMFDPGQHTVTYQATVMGQTATCSFTVKVNDKESPVIPQPDNVVTHIEPGTCGKAVTFTEPLATDNCSNSVITQRVKGLSSGAFFPIGTTIEKYITFDIINTDSVVFTITVLDTIAPSFMDVSDVVETSNDMCGTIVSFSTPAATDNSSCFTVAKLGGLNSGDRFPIGTTSQTYLVKDAAGNTDTTRFNIIVNATPDVDFYNCPADVVTVSDNGMTKVVWYDIPGRNSCTGVTSLLLSGKGSGATFPAGTTWETYLLTDASGRTDTCSFRVIVTEMNPPYVMCNEPYKFELVDSICGALVKIPFPDVDDFGGSGLDTIFNDLGHRDSLIFLPIGITNVLWTAIDNSGNRGYCYGHQMMVGKEDSPNNPISNQTKVCEGSNVEIYPDMIGEGPYTYEWSYYDETIYDYVVISTDSIFRITNVQESHERQYVYRVMNPCNYMVYQREFMLRVNPSPAVTLTGLDAGYCEYDSIGKSLSFTPAGGVLVGQGLEEGKFYPYKAGVGTNNLSYVYYDSTLACPGTANFTVNVYDTPEVDAFIDTAYCINNLPLQLDAVNSSYSGPGISGTTFSPVSANAGTHIISRTVTVNGCVNILAQTVRIKGNVPDATILTTGSLCSNQDLVKLEAATPGGTWTGPAVYIDSNEVAYFNVHIATLGQHKVVYKLTKDVCTGKDSVLIDVKDSDYGLPFTFDAYCYDEGSVALDVSDNKSYFGYGIENNIFNPLVYDTTTTALYGVVTLNSNGCVDTVFRALAVLKPEIIDSIKLVCNQAEAVELAVNTNLESVKWFDNSTAYTKIVTGTGNYTVELHNSSGCIKTDTFYVKTKQSVLHALINNTRELYKCISSGISLNADAGYSDYSWSTGEQGSSITVNAPGKYKVYVTDDEDCDLLDSIMVSNYEAIENNQISDEGTHLEAIESNSYEWYKNGMLIQGAEERTLTPTESGNYYVSLIDSNGCTSASDVIQVTLTSIFGASRNTECLIYPNPGKGNYVFEFSRQPETDLDIVIYNAIGKQVHQLSIDSQAAHLIYPVNLEDQPSGVYWAHIRQRDRTTVVKIVKAE